MSGLSAEATTLRCRLLGHKWINVRSWDADGMAAYFCARCAVRKPDEAQ
jgi:hypothetical protein